MTISPGSRLGQYEIAGPLGAGGMGEVYRARDAKLGREIAIKVLPAGLSDDAARRRRFEQEARAASALNHPGIVTIYDIGSADGVTYIAMELVDGRTVRDILAEAPLLPRKLLEIGAQAAEGLARAHAAGIVHRDLKPENLMVTRDGFVKILDFGLAKLSDPSAAHLSEASTAVAPPTEPGTVLGTVPYMSPEQASGQPLDFRSDQFALGSILYEMAAGKRPFHRRTVAETLTAIIREDPEPLGHASPATPAPLRWIIERCLAKDPAERYDWTGDLARELAGVREHLSETSLAAGPAPAASARGKPRGWLLPVALAIAAAAAAWISRGFLADSKITHPRFHRLTYRRGPVWSARFTQDGKTIVYAASWDGAQAPELYSVRVESPEALRLALPPARLESISRAGEMLLLNKLPTSRGAPSTLSQVPLSGSAPRDLLEDVVTADWSPDGGAFAVVRAPQSGLSRTYRLEFPPGKVLHETKTGWLSHVRVSPGGDSVAFLDHPVVGDSLGSVAILDRSGRMKTLSAGWGDARGVAWSPDGAEVWFTASQTGQSNALHAVTLSGKLRTVATTPGDMVLQDVAADGRVLFVHGNERAGFFALLPGEAKERDLSGLDFSISPILSDDAKTVVFTEAGFGGSSGNYSVYLRRLDGSPAVRLGEGTALAISHDGKWVLARLIRPSPAQLVLHPTGAGQKKTFPKDSIDHAGAAAILPGGRGIVFVGNEPGRPRRTFFQDLEGGPARPVTPEGIGYMLLSPDGASLLVRAETRQFLRIPLQGGPGSPVAGIDPAEAPLRWTSDGRALYVRSLARQLPARIDRIDVQSGRREVWREFMPADPAGISRGVMPADISSDGGTVLFSYFRMLSDLYLAEGLQ